VVIEVLVTDFRGLDTDGKIEALAGEIRRKNDQQTVLLMRIPAVHKFKVARKRKETRQNLTHKLKSALRVPCASADEVYLEDVHGRPLPPGKRASRRGRILAGFGEWEKLLGGGAVVQGSIVRFFSD